MRRRPPDVRKHETGPLVVLPNIRIYDMLFSMDTKEGIRALLTIAWMAAYLQSLFPLWVKPDTPRKKIPPDSDRWKIQVTYEWTIKWDVDPLPYFESPHPDIVVELVEHRINVVGVSEVMDGRYSIGLGFNYSRPTDFGIVLYWTEKWVKADAKEFFEWLNTMNK